MSARASEPDLRITFRDVAVTPALEAHVLSRAKKLRLFAPYFTRCEVTLDAPRSDARYHRVRIELTVLGKRLVVARKPPICSAREDLYESIDAAFDEARRQLVEHIRTPPRQAACAKAPAA